MKNTEQPAGWLDIFFLSIFCASALFGTARFLFLLRDVVPPYRYRRRAPRAN